MALTASSKTVPESNSTQTEVERRRETVRYHATYLLLACAVLAAAAVLQIDDRDRVVIPGLHLHLPESCAYLRFVGTQCPGCGLTRCFICLLDCRYREAWDYNPGGYLVFLVVAIQLPYRAVQMIRTLRGKLELSHRSLSTAIVLLIVAALFGQWLLRLATS